MYMMEKKKKGFWTLRYAGINMSYFAVFCGIHAYASVFLLDKGFTNTQIGLCLAIANILSVFVQPYFAGLIDKQGKLTNRNVSAIATLLLILGSILLLVIKNSAVAIFVIYALIYMIQMSYQPLIIAMNFEYEQAGCNIAFGLARGLGSAGFAVTSALIGGVVARHGVDVLQIMDILILCLSLILILTFVKPRGANAEALNAHSDDTDINNGAHNNVIDFAKEYPMFVVFLIATVCFFFAHNAINDYLIQIITPLGGNEAQMGYAIFIAALLELPTMALISVIIKKISPQALLTFAGVMFLVKMIILTLATGMVGVYISEACQMGAYAVFIPVAAYYVNQTMAAADQVKGQAYVNCGITLGGVFSGVICGRILDAYGPKTMLVIGCVVTVIGIVLTCVAVRKR